MPSTVRTEPAHVAVIGCGGVGARHLQSLARLDTPAQVFAVDPSPDALSRAAALFAGWKPADGEVRNNLTLLTSSRDLPGQLDVAVVATRAEHRLDALCSLRETAQVEHLILEKFLFARRPDFAAGAKALADRPGAKTLVNCPRRIYPGYMAMARQLQGAKHVHLHVSAGARIAPLGTIGIHFVDLLDFLCGEGGPVECSPVLNGSLTVGNRGLRDFAGTLRVTVDGPTVGTMTIDAIEDEGRPLWVTVDSDRGRFVVNERDQTYDGSTPETDWKCQRDVFKVPFQSELTSGVVEQLLIGRDPGLTEFGRSIALHLPLFDTLMDCYRRAEGDPLLDQVPFT